MTDAAVLMPVLVPALFIGLLGSAHCFAMCGGIAAALSFGQHRSATMGALTLHVCYSLGRVAGYTLMAFLVALLFQTLPFQGGGIGRWVVAVILLLVGLSYLNVWQGVRYIEKIGAGFWRRIKPLGQTFLPIDRPHKALIVGCIWGWLPCGLVYAALAYAVAQPTLLQSALSMLVFGVGTLPAVVLSGLFASKLKTLLGSRRVRATTGIAFVLFALWTVGAPLLYPHHHAGHGADAKQDHLHHENHHHH